MDLSLTNKIRRGEIDINNQSLFFSILSKGLLRKLYNDLSIRKEPIPHIILNTGDDTLYLSVKGQDQSIEPLQVSNEDYIYSQIPRCIVSPKGINLLPDQLTTPYTRGVFQYEDDDNCISFSAEFRRMPLTMSFDLTYYLDSYKDSLDLMQQLITKLSFIQTYNITYMGQTIICSYKIPENLENEFNINIDGSYSDDKHRKISISLEVETNIPVFNNRSVIQNDHIIKNTSFTIHDSNEQLYPSEI